MPSISPVTAQWEWLFSLYATIGWIVGVAVIGWLIYYIIRYRFREGMRGLPDSPKEGKVPPDRGTVKGALILTAVVTGILFTITLGTMQTVDLIEKPPSKSTLVIKVTGFQWGWRFIYPNGRVEVNKLTVPKGELIIFEVTSEDVFHNFGLPEFKVKADAIPGYINRIWIKPEVSGNYTIMCYELCGVGHSWMKGRLLVIEPEDFEVWYKGGKGE